MKYAILLLIPYFGNSQGALLTQNSNGYLTFTDSSIAPSKITGLATLLNQKANLASPTFTGTVSGITASMVGLGNVTNESKATMFTSPTFTGTVTYPASQSFTTPNIGAATATTLNGHTFTAGSSTFTGTAAKTYTFPASTATVVGRVATAQIASTASATSTTTLFTPPADGFYRVNIYLKITTTGTSPVAGPVTITYTDALGSVAQSHVMLLQSVTGSVVTTTVNNSTTTGTVNGSMVIYAKASVAIQYAIAVSGTFGAGRYQAFLTCEAL